LIAVTLQTCATVYLTTTCPSRYGYCVDLPYCLQVAPAEEAGEEAEVKPQNSTERDVDLNLAVALRMIEERG
jgi:hypothetical protein